MGDTRIVISETGKPLIKKVLIKSRTRDVTSKIIVLEPPSAIISPQFTDDTIVRPSIVKAKLFAVVLELSCINSNVSPGNIVSGV